jgi:hypothetical protein
MYGTVMRTVVRLFTLILAFQAHAGFAQTEANKRSSAASQQRDGQHDFDFQFGTWKTHLRRLLRPLTGSTTWVEYNGTTVVRKVWNGRANLVELVVDGPAGHFEGLNLRLYDPKSQQWSLNFSGLVGLSSHSRKMGARLGR